MFGSSCSCALAVDTFASSIGFGAANFILLLERERKRMEGGYALSEAQLTATPVQTMYGTSMSVDM